AALCGYAAPLCPGLSCGCPYRGEELMYNDEGLPWGYFRFLLPTRGSHSRLARGGEAGEEGAFHGILVPPFPYRVRAPLNDFNMLRVGHSRILPSRRSGFGELGNLTAAVTKRGCPQAGGIS
ncbi:MAG: hypothetical protein NTY19_16675, partial [Planctomycetota bacterium]|nr:hypothetical protein [Planctomycetota bacterium]